MPPAKWRSYEEVATHLLNEMAAGFGLDRVEGKQAVQGLRSGTNYTIDAKGIRATDGAFLIIECRRHTTSRQKQEHLAGLAYRILDTGAAGWIIVTPLGLQEGAQKIAAAEKVIVVQLTQDSSTKDYVLGFLNQLHAGATDRICLQEHAVAVLRNVVTGEETRVEGK